MKRTREKLHSTYLFPSIVLLLVAQPVVAALFATNSELLTLPTAVTLGAVSWSLDSSGRWFRAGLALALAAIASVLVHQLTLDSVLPVVTGACVISLGVLCIALGVRSLLRSTQVTAEKLLTAMSVYLLIGAIFGVAFALLHRIDPACFRGVDSDVMSADTADFLYFSLGTLTTTAYGDILPVHPIARLLANIEAVVGQMYLAVLVARLVSGYRANRDSAEG